MHFPTFGNGRSERNRNFFKNVKLCKHIGLVAYLVIININKSFKTFLSLTVVQDKLECLGNVLVFKQDKNAN
jgi:hypothetical protein